MRPKQGNHIISFINKEPIISVLAGLTIVGIVLSMVLYFETVSDVVTALPLFISIIIMLLQSRANRYSFLLGSLNSVFYAIVYFAFELQASALSALLISLPVQMFTFIRWHKHKYKDSTVFKKMSVGIRMVSFVAGVVAVFVMMLLLKRFGSEYIILDTIASVAGIGVYILTFFSFIEYPFLQIFNGVIIGINYVIMIADGKYTLIPYLIYAVYQVICVIKGAVWVCRLYVEQQDSGKDLIAKEG